MGKLFKYEIKGSFKAFIAIFISAVLLNLFMLFSINSDGVRMGLSISVWGIAFLFVLIFSINSFKRELYESRGYLTFTLPINGRQYVIVKMISAFLWFTVTYILMQLCLYIVGETSIPRDILIPLRTALYSKEITIVSIIVGLLWMFDIMLLIYFSITITKVGLKKGKLSGFVGFIVFIIISFLKISVLNFLITILPYSSEIKSRSLEILHVQGEFSFMNLPAGSLVGFGNGFIQFNIAACIFSILVLVGMFIATSYLIDTKIDL